MSRLPDQTSSRTIYSVDAVRRLDRAAIEGAGIEGYTLMSRAGRAAVDHAIELFPEARRWQVVCGGGNNAGDGYVVARLAAERDIPVSVCALVDPETLTGDARRAYTDFAAAGCALAPWGGALDADADLLVDALLGSGLERDVGGAFAAAVDAMNAHAARVVALDVPTGIGGDTGAVMGVAVRADATVTFVGLKTGLFLDAGPSHTGVLRFDDLAIPAGCRSGIAGELRALGADSLPAAFPPRPRNAHKGDFGHVVVVGGGPGMPGAARLAGEAALRCGAGLVTVVTHPGHGAALLAGRPELMCRPAERPADVLELLSAASVVALGPGLGRDAWAEALFDPVLGLDKPLVLDADALNLLAARPAARDDWILTPHPGEASRLLQADTAEIQADRPAALRRLTERYGGIVVLKGMGSLIGSQSGSPWLCTAGNPGMASPGMGDVLTGVVAGLRAQGFDAEEAAVFGVEVHARAGDHAAEPGERGLLASDVMQELRRWVNP